MKIDHHDWKTTIDSDGPVNKALQCNQEKHSWNRCIYASVCICTCFDTPVFRPPNVRTHAVAHTRYTCLKKGQGLSSLTIWIGSDADLSECRHIPFGHSDCKHDKNAVKYNLVYKSKWNLVITSYWSRYKKDNHSVNLCYGINKTFS